MSKILLYILTLFMAGTFGACASIQEKLSSGADRTADKFFEHFIRSNTGAAHDLFAKNLSEMISSPQLDGLISTMRKDWGMLREYETVVIPFHERIGERNFIPDDVAVEQIKQYTYELKFDRATINCDLTLAPQGEQYKIIWISFWGSRIYMTPDIQEKLELIHDQSR